jgi:hypothetical protein
MAASGAGSQRVSFLIFFSSARNSRLRHPFGLPIPNPCLFQVSQLGGTIVMPLLATSDACDLIIFSSALFISIIKRISVWMDFRPFFGIVSAAFFPTTTPPPPPPPALLSRPVCECLFSARNVQWRDGTNCKGGRKGERRATCYNDKSRVKTEAAAKIYRLLNWKEAEKYDVRIIVGP